MKTTQKRILWAAVVAIVLAATIVFVVLGVSGHTFTELKKKSSGKPQATGSIDEIFKAVENALKGGSQYTRVFMKVTTMADSVGKVKMTVTVLGSNKAPSLINQFADMQIRAIQMMQDMDEIKTEQLKGPADAVTTLFTDLTQKLDKISHMINLDLHRLRSPDLFFRFDAK